MQGDPTPTGNGSSGLYAKPQAVVIGVPGIAMQLEQPAVSGPAWQGGNGSRRGSMGMVSGKSGKLPIVPLRKMLPIHKHPHMLVRYKVKSSDVLSQSRVMVEDLDGNVIWYKERTLYDNEVIDSIFQNTTPPRLCWTVHTPKRGWYIRLRSPAFPPGAFVHVKAAEAGPDVAPGTLTFGCQTFVFDYAELAAGTPRSSLSSAVHAPPPPSHEERPEPEPEASCSSSSISSDSHSYPPTPSLESSQQNLLDVPGLTKPGPSAKMKARAPPPRPMQISHFVLTPTSRHRVRHAADDTPPPKPSLLSRLLPSMLHEPKANSYTSAFELDIRAPEPATPSMSPIPERAVAVPPPRPPPLMTFLDETPVLSVRTTGTLEINPKLESRLGVERSFWISVALAYLEFLEERDAFLASEESH